MEMEKWINEHIPHIITGWCCSLLVYIEPLQAVIQLMVILTLIDFATGLFASIKAGKALSSLRMWRTVVKIFYEALVVVLLFSIDKEVGSVELHKIVAWFICGVEFWSILENICKVSNSRVFRLIKILTELKVRDFTHININENERNDTSEKDK